MSVFLGGEYTTYLRAQTIPGQFVYSVACIFEAWCPSVCNLQCCHHARVHRNVPVSLRVVVSLKQFKTDSGENQSSNRASISLYPFFLSPPVNVSIVVIRRNEGSPHPPLFPPSRNKDNAPRAETATPVPTTLSFPYSLRVFFSKPPARIIEEEGGGGGGGFVALQ